MAELVDAGTTSSDATTAAGAGSQHNDPQPATRVALQPVSAVLREAADKAARGAAPPPPGTSAPADDLEAATAAPASAVAEVTAAAGGRAAAAELAILLKGPPGDAAVDLGARSPTPLPAPLVYAEVQGAAERGGQAGDGAVAGARDAAQAAAASEEQQLEMKLAELRKGMQQGAPLLPCKCLGA